MILTAPIVFALIFLYWKGWLTFTQTGIFTPFINLTIAGFAVQIKQPDNDDPGTEEPR